jgi:hypothetical protein
MKIVEKNNEYGMLRRLLFAQKLHLVSEHAQVAHRRFWAAVLRGTSRWPTLRDDSSGILAIANGVE